MRPIVSRGQVIVSTDEGSFLRRPKLARVPEPIAGLNLWRTRIEIVRTEHDPGPLNWSCFHTAKEILRARPPKKDEAVSLIGELQYTLTKNAVAKLNMGVGVTKKALTYAPEIGVIFRF